MFTNKTNFVFGIFKKVFLISGVLKSSILIEIPAFVAYWNPNSFNESKSEEDEILPKLIKVSWTMFSKVFCDGAVN